jgi:hypothetical protein
MSTIGCVSTELPMVTTVDDDGTLIIAQSLGQNGAGTK